MLAGYVDANAFVHLGGYFVSFMSGNSTRLGVGLAQQSGAAATAGGLIALLWLGLVVGAVLGAAAYAHFGLLSLRAAAATAAVLTAFFVRVPS